MIKTKPLIIAVASGKGGTGKTTLSTNLALLLSESVKVDLVDLDVEEPNVKLFLNPVIEKEKEIKLPIPHIDPSLCTFCGLCANRCEFNALAILPANTLFFQELCHSCGRCKLVCPQGAISEINHRIGTFSFGKKDQVIFYEGLLDQGNTQTSALISKIKKELTYLTHFQIRDCPPGTTCPMIESVKGADFVILVTEPTPFGLNDLSIAYEAVKAMRIPLGIVINKSSENDTLIENFCNEKEIKIIGKLPYSREAAKKIAQGYDLLNISGFRKEFEKIINFFDEMRVKS